MLPTITLTKAREAEQTAYLFSEQTWSCTAEGEPNEAGGYFPGWARNGQKFLQWKYLKLYKKNCDKKYGVEIKLKNWIFDNTKKNKNCDITLKLKT